MKWEDAIKSKAITERWYEVACVGCEDRATSDHYDTRSHKAIDKDAEFDAFLENLEKRGWHILRKGSVLCPRCCDDLVLERVGNAFKDALMAKAGDAK